MMVVVIIKNGRDYKKLVKHLMDGLIVVGTGGEDYKKIKVDVPKHNSCRGENNSMIGTIVNEENFWNVDILL